MLVLIVMVMVMVMVIVAVTSERAAFHVCKKRLQRHRGGNQVGQRRRVGVEKRSSLASNRSQQR